jgi:beta-lactamase regulating signal transducer with metallopeptidase domain
MQTLLDIGLSNALFAAVLAIAVFALTRIARTPALGHLLWALVLLKLITPPLFSVPVLRVLPSWETARNALSLPQANPPAAVSSLSAASANVEFAEPPYSEPVLDARESLTPATSKTAAGSVATVSNELSPNGASPFASLYWSPDWNYPVLFSTWTLGSLFCLALALLRIRHFQKLLSHATLAPAAVQLEAQALAKRLGMTRSPSVWLAPGQFSPLLWAVGEPRLIIPADLLKSLVSDQQASLLAHELAHARRRDHWVRWLELVATCLYWWNPVAWWARKELQQAEERCCDAWVVWALPKAAKAYAKALLQTVEFLDARPALPPAASGIGHVHLLKRRLNMIVRNPSHPRLGWPAYLAVALFGVVVLPLGAERLFAQAPADTAVVVQNDDDDDQPGGDSQRRDVERRLDRLEQRMDKLLHALESRQEGQGTARKDKQGKEEKRAVRVIRDSDEPKGRGVGRGEGDGKQEKKVIRVIRDSDEKDSKESKDSKGDKVKTERRRVRVFTDADADKMKELHKRLQDTVHQAVDPDKIKELHKTIEDSVHKAIDPEKMKELHKVIENSVHQAVDPEKMKDLQKHIKVIVDENLDPEKMKKLQKEIDESVRRNFNPERMKQMEKQIEESVKRSIDPKKMERLGREIEESVKRSIDPQKMEALGRHIEEIVNKETKRADEAKKESNKAGRQADRLKERAERAERTARAEKKKPGSQDRDVERRDRDVERRIERLEQRLDRVLEKLESRKGDDE